MFDNCSSSKIVSLSSIRQVKYLNPTKDLLILSNEKIILYNLVTFKETILLNEKGTFITL